MRNPRRTRSLCSWLAALAVVACGAADDGSEPGTSDGRDTGTSTGGTPTGGGPTSGGATGSGGAATGGLPGTGGLGTGGASSGGDAPSGGTTPTGGTAIGGLATGGSSSGGLATGGAATGGFPTGGSSSGGLASGGVATGGFPTGGSSSGGLATGGAATGGFPTGGDGTGGSATGGTETGGAATGGAATGGAGNGGAETGGAATGSAGTCNYPEPPADVAAWVDESWNAQLDDNIRGRSAWLFDSVMMGEGEINLCVRWGATTAPSAALKEKLGSSVQRWFNDWFTGMGDYGCFPYSDGVTVRVTGWAVRPGHEGWVSDLDDTVRIYTETDGEGEPKCPDACSFFDNWDHRFPDCPGGEAAHTDYWIWLDDALPGGGAAAVGGDWGLRIPLSSFEAALDRTSDGVVEHEMGHGFGLQDYYDWTGSRPAGGSIMIVGSSSSSRPTTADLWLLRRTWAEMQQLRGW